MTPPSGYHVTSNDAPVGGDQTATQLIFSAGNPTIVVTYLVEKDGSETKPVETADPSPGSTPASCLQVARIAEPSC